MSANEENECPICSRIEFDGGAACKVCRYPLPGHRAVDPADVFGCDIMIEVMTGMVGTKMIEKHFKGSEATARSRAIMVKGFRRVVAVRPLTQDKYLMCYGEGRM